MDIYSRSLFTDEDSESQRDEVIIQDLKAG